MSFKSEAGRKPNHPEDDYIFDQMNFAGQEAFKRLRTNVEFSFTDDKPCHVIGITSYQAGVGKSLCCLNLAYSFSMIDSRVVVIDCDMRLPSLSRKTGVEASPGLSNLLTGAKNVRGALHSIQHGTSSFDLIAGGDVPPNPSELLHSARFASLVSLLSEKYDYIILDLPPVGIATDAQVAAPVTDGMLLVVHEGACTESELLSCVQQLKMVNCRILGTILNGSVAGASKKYGYGKYGSYGHYGNYNHYSKADHYADAYRKYEAAQPTEDKKCN